MKLRDWMQSGTPQIWLTAGSVAISLVMVFGVLWLTAFRGLGHFWPSDLYETAYRDKGQTIRVIGEIAEEEAVSAKRLSDAGFALPSDITIATRYLFKLGNRDALGFDFRWFPEPLLGDLTRPAALLAVERREWGNFYGYLKAVKEKGQVVAEGEAAWNELDRRVARTLDLFAEIHRIEKGEVGNVNYGIERLRLKQRQLELDGALTLERRAQLDAKHVELNKTFAALQERLKQIYTEINRDSFSAEIMDGRVVDVPLAKVVRVYRPNAMNVAEKLGFYFVKLWEFVADEPREANTEGGIFPAIFGTVLMVLVMSVLVTPLGIIAAVYMREYAKQGPLIRTIRISVNNLAGVPSIVYGVFGLGFFVYFLGGNIDQLFFPEALPAPTFGTPGILWSSLTLALLTLPVVIVATEEGLARIPSTIRHGSLALGATKAETLWRTVLPMASPAMMTGLILAIARAAGEVAPLMLVGVVKLAPSLPLDDNFPFLHLDRKFMHLGFHIYDVGFQSPNVEAARPLVYATSLLLVAIIMALNLVAISLRNRLRNKYRMLDI